MTSRCTKCGEPLFGNPRLCADCGAENPDYEAEDGSGSLPAASWQLGLLQTIAFASITMTGVLAMAVIFQASGMPTVAGLQASFLGYAFLGVGLFYLLLHTELLDDRPAAQTIVLLVALLIFAVASLLNPMFHGRERAKSSKESRSCPASATVNALAPIVQDRHIGAGAG